MKKKLAKAETVEHRTVVKSHTGVVFVGSGADDYECANCAAIVAERIEPNSVWDVVVECKTCGKPSSFPHAGASTKLPAMVVGMDEGVFVFNKPVFFPPGAVTVGAGAAHSGRKNSPS